MKLVIGFFAHLLPACVFLGALVILVLALGSCITISVSPTATPSTSQRTSPPPMPRGASVLATVAETGNQVLGGGSYITLPPAGISVSPGHVLSLTWSADGSLDCFILTQTQFGSFKPFGVASGWVQYSSGSNGSISAYVQNYDTYYAVVRNTFTLGSPIKVYQAVLTLQ